jgi:SAM-dependent methyltransferase
MMTLSAERFSSRVDDYLKYRPHYPNAVIDALRDRTMLRPSHIVADVGSGTGFSSELFLENGNFVYGIEPNKPMREAGEKYLSTYKNFRSIDATAEATTLEDRSVDYIVAGQAFHWFNFERAYEEFKRILKPGGWLVILWNDRETDTTPFLIDYEALLQEFGTDYNEINHRNIDSKKVQAFFQASPPMLGAAVSEMDFENVQTLDYEGAEGRLLSSSYVPNVEDPLYEPMLRQLRELLDKHAEGGRVEMRYRTLLYFGQLNIAGN